MESVCTLWLECLNGCASVKSSVMKLAGLSATESQHIEPTPSRSSHNWQDVSNVVSVFFFIITPFDLMTIAI